MATAVGRGISAVGISLKNIIFFLLFAAVILFLFFIPEILKLNWSDWLSSRVRPAAVLESSAVREFVSPLEEVIDRINSGYYAVEKTMVEAAGSEPQQITWEYIKSNQSKAKFTQAVALARSLLTKYRDSDRNMFLRNALLQFIAGIELIEGEGSKVMSAAEAAAYLENLDLRVARALQTDSVSRDDYLNWMEVSVAPAIAGARAQSIKRQMLKPFNPNLRLTRLDISKSKTTAGSQQPALTQMRLRGSIKGDDINKISLYHNGSYLSDIRFDRPNREGRREFVINQRDATGLWTIRIEDKAKNIYEKTYRFFPIIESYPQDRSTYQLRYSEEGLDPAIDKLFTVSEKIPGIERLGGFVEF